MRKYAFVLLVLTLSGCSPTQPATETDAIPSAAPATKRLRAVFHLNSGDPAHQERALKTVANVVGGVRREGGDPVVELVCHGDAIHLLVTDTTAHPDKLAALAEAGVVFAACNNTMRERGITRQQLLPTVRVVPSAAIEILSKQQDGYAYFKP